MYNTISQLCSEEGHTVVTIFMLSLLEGQQRTDVKVLEHLPLLPNEKNLNMENRACQM